tara:strand:- start:3860 stop:4618 length:759 start_codon:yes stop_codon:yes gene_type:complete
MFYTLDAVGDIVVDKARNIYLDVGTAIGMPHGAAWLYHDENSFVIGVEPNIECLKTLETGRPPAPFPTVKLGDATIWRDGEEIKQCDPARMAVFHCAIDDVGGRTSANFFHTDERNIGCSSLLQPTDKLGLDVVNQSAIDVCSLEYLLDSLGMQDVEKITFIKTDTQGKDFDVVRSLGKYLPRVLALKCECNVAGQYENSNSKDEFLQYMEDNQFALIHDNGYDVIFVSMRPMGTKEDVLLVQSSLDNFHPE